MKIKFTTIILCLFVNLCLSQGSNPLDLTVPSPQAFELTKYGNVPVDESSGRVSPSIPIHTYKAGKLELGINLAYSGNGVKVEQKPTWTGINWLLNAGGVITRMVKDLPDETDKPRVFYTESELENMAIHTYQIGNHVNSNDLHPDVKSNLVNNYVADLNSHDTEVDIFSYSFNGHSGSFYLKEVTDGVFEPKLLKYDEELKIEIIGSFTEYGTYSFKITTPNGDVYYFGGDTLTNPGSTETNNTIAIEENQTVDKETGIPIYGVRAKTAFYLTKIENNFGDNIYLEYITNPTSEIFLAKEYTRYAKIYDSNPNMPPKIPGADSGGYVCYGGLPTENNLLDVKLFKNITYNAKHLKRIWSYQNPNKIIFNSLEVINYINSQEAFGIKFRVLSTINFETKIVDFEYIPNKANITNNLHREKFFLNKVTFKNADGSQKAEEYVMEYDDPLSAPQNSISNAQDFLGYYNGKTSNPSLLPKNSLKYLQYYLDLTTASSANFNMNYVNFQHRDFELGDREPNFSDAIKGTLTKIKYPTGGFTTFEYEPVTTETKYLYTGAYMHLYNDTGATMPRNPITQLMDSEGIAYYDQLFNENSDIFPVYISQMITVSLSINLRSTMFAFSDKDYVYIKMKNIDTNEEVVKKWFFPSQSADYITSFNPTLDFSLTKDNRYTFTLGMGKMPGNVLYNSSNMTALLNMIPFDISASFNYIYGIDADHVNGAGIRIKRIKDFDGVETAPSSNKRFYYSSLKKIMNKETPETDKVITFNPLFHSFYRDAFLCSYIPGFREPQVESLPFYRVQIFAFLNSNSFTLNLPSSDVHAMYPVVTTSLGGDNFETGAIEKRFRIENDIRPTLFQNCIDCDFVNSFVNFRQNVYTNNSNYNGTLLKETYWDKTTSLKKIKEINYSYEFGIRATQNNLFGTTNGNDGYYGHKACISFYNILSHRTNKILVTTKEFVDGIPIAKYLPPFHLYNGWGMDDHDGDGIWNSADEDFITPDEFYTISEEEIEEPFKKIVNTQEITYATNLAGLPKQIITNDSTSGENKVINYYPITTDIASLTGLSSDEIDAYNTLKTQNRISNPIQIENFKNSDLLSKQRFIYNFFDEITPISLHKVKTSKHTSNFEDRIIYNKYDNKGNPVEILLSDKNMLPTVYIWNNQRQPIYKVINATHSSVVNAINAAPIISTDNLYSLTPLQLNPFITLLPNSLTYIYNYDPLTDLLSYSIDPKGNLQTYHYDSFNRLQFVKDAQGNILSENEYHYKN